MKLRDKPKGMTDQEWKVEQVIGLTVLVGAVIAVVFVLVLLVGRTGT